MDAGESKKLIVALIDKEIRQAERRKDYAKSIWGSEDCCAIKQDNKIKAMEEVKSFFLENWSSLNNEKNKMESET